jgi:iron complex outermembrane receptor protein
VVIVLVTHKGFVWRINIGDEHGLGLNDAGVESVEVIKGPASLLYDLMPWVVFCI